MRSSFPSAKPLDPLGLLNLGRYITKLSEAVKAGDLPAAQASLGPLSQAHEDVLLSYEQLVDRYGLLKRSCRHLAEEVAWLRDQCDDFAGERQELMEEAKARRS